MNCSPCSPVKKENNSSARVSCAQYVSLPGRTILTKASAVPKPPEIQEKPGGTNQKKVGAVPSRLNQGEQIKKKTAAVPSRLNQGEHF